MRAKRQLFHKGRLAFAAFLVLLIGAWAGEQGTTAVQLHPRLVAVETPAGSDKAPEQRWGDAAGLDPVVAGRRNTVRPTSERSKYPPVKAPTLPANAARVMTAPQGQAKRFGPGAGPEIATRRGPHERAYRNPDGTETTEFSAAPLNYRKPDGSWAPIDSKLTADPDGGWRRGADSVDLKLAARADASELVRVTFPGGGVLAYGAAGAAAVAGKVAGDTATYPGVWPDVDVELRAQPGGVKETLVLGSADAPTGFVFPLQLSGLTAAVENGQVLLRDAKKTTVATIPAGYLVDAEGAVSSGVSYRLTSRDGRPALAVDADAAWLRAAGRAFPVRLDPPVLGNGSVTESLIVQGGTSHGGGDLSVGRKNGVNSASYVKFGGLVSSLAHETIFSAQLSFAAFDAPSCKPRALGVYPVTGSWTANDHTSYPGPSVGGALASASFAQGYVGLGQSSSACPVTGTVLDLGTKGRDLVQGWVDGKANNGISFRAAVSDESAWKTIAGTGSANPPTLYVTHTPYNAKYSVPSPTPKPAVLQNQAGKVKVTVTNKSAMDWTPSGFQLVYRLYNAKTQAKIGQYVAATLPGTVARGSSTTLDATIKALPIGSYILDFSMATTSGRVFTDELVPPARIALEVRNIPPALGGVYPPNGYESPNLTPQLWAQGVDLDAPPKQTLQYKFEYCAVDASANPTGCTQTAYQTKQSFTVPAGKLAWSKPYVWRAFVKDNTTEVAGDYATLTTVVPQPEITSRVANAPYGSGDKDFDPDLGNYSTSAVDATEASAGPDLSILRTYNSLDPRADLAFGAGWMSELDMRVALDADGSGNALITYPDGQQVRYGRNSDGTFAAPLGRTGQLSIASSTYVLKDQANTTYTFRGGDGRIASITDKYSRVLEFVYDSQTGRLTKLQTKRAPSATKALRALTLTWNTAGTHVQSVATDPVNGSALTWTYTYDGDRLTKVCAPEGQACTTYSYADGSHYRSSVTDSGPDSYWRLGEKAGATAAASDVPNNLGKDAGTLANVTLEQPGALAGGDDTAAQFNGTTSVAELPKGVVKRGRDTAVELWFTVSAVQSGGPLLGYQDTALGTTPATGVPLLYVGTDGHVRGQFKTTATTPKPIDGGADLRDGKWHHVVLSVAADVQTLYVDGVKKGTKAATDGVLDQSLLTFNQAGAGWATTPTAWPSWGSTAKRFFQGGLDEIAVYGHPLSDQSVKAHYSAGAAKAGQLTAITLPSGKTAAEMTYDSVADRIAEYTDGNGGTWKIGKPVVHGGDTDLRRTVQVLDPADNPYLYEYDALAGRLLRSASPLGISTRPADQPLPTPTPTPTPSEVCTTPDPGDPRFCTVIPGDAGGPIFDEHPLNGSVVRSFQYDAQGRQNQVIDENGNVVTMTFDSRGNVASRKTCRGPSDCQTTYTSYTSPNTANPLDPRNDLPVEVRDPRSSSATDNTYRTITAYNTSGDVTSETGPDSGVTATTYTNGSEFAFGSATDTLPTGLIRTSTDAAGKVTRYDYTAAGDLAQVTWPSGMLTQTTYDALGRKTQEKEISDSYPSGVVTQFAYDNVGRPTVVTGPVTVNAVDGTRHQAVTTTTYDVDGNVVRTSVKDALDANEADRVTTVEYDEHNHQTRTVNPEGDEQTEGWDRFGNRVSVVDGNGNHYEYAYTARNQLSEVRLYDWKGDPDGGPGQDSKLGYIVVNSYAYDYGGRMAAQIDSMGRRIEYTYLGDDLLSKAVLKNFHDPDGSTRDYVMEQYTYDAAGNVTRQTTANGTQVSTNVIDKLGRTQSSTLDPGGLNRVTTFGYDLLGNVVRTTTSGNAVNVPWPVVATATNVTSNVYDAKGRLSQEKVLDGTASRTTSYTYDQRGLTLSQTDPRGNAAGADAAAFTTTYKYDENGDQIAAIAPAVSVESGGNAAQTANPTVTTGYNAFGEPVAVKDELGNITRSTYDRMGRPVSVEGPRYTAPGAPSTAASGVLKTKYDALGNVIESTDAKQHITKYTYDRLNRLTQKDMPGATDDERLVTRYTYTRTGKMLSTTTPTGIRVQATYDDLDRPVTSTTFERKPAERALTTTTTYDDASNAVKVTSPTGLVTTMTYDKAGDLLTVRDPAGVTRTSGYDGFGNKVRETDAAGRTTRLDYNAFGSMVAQINLGPDGNELRRETFGYDESGNVTSRTDALKKTTTFAYDNLGQLIRQVEPKSATATITTSWGYDAAGNRTRYTDGRGLATYYTTNSLGLPESVVEPATTAQPAASDRTWTVAYDLNGDPTTLTAPGGVVRSRSYDAAGRLTAEQGSGGGTAAVSRGYSYDAEGRTTAVTTGAGGSANTFGYDDRGDLLSVDGVSGKASYTYDDEGQLTSRTDAAGTATFGYQKGRITTVRDGVSGVPQTMSYDAAGALSGVDYGAGRVRKFGYDDLDRLTTDTLKNSDGSAVSSITYKYDLADRVIGKDTTGTAGAGSNTYGYDDADRLTSWTSSAGTVAYAWDDSGNRVRAGAKTATYDERNRLLSDGDYTYTYTPRGTLASRTSSGLTDQYSFDAFDRMVSSQGQTYVYDGLDRMINRNGALITYSGTGPDPIGDTMEKYGRGPGGELLSVAESPDNIKLTVSDQHDDVVGAFDADGSLTSLDSSTEYDPFGNRVAQSGTASNVGFQGDWTDPDTGQVDMGARWYQPGTGTFTSRDSASYSSGASILANKYTYAAGDPMANNDPSGNWPSCGWCHKVIDTVIVKPAKAVYHGVVNTAKSLYHGGVQVAKDLYHGAVRAGNWLVDQAVSAASHIERAYHYVSTKVSHALSSAKQAAVSTWNNTIKPSLQHAYNVAKQKAQAAYRASVHVMTQAKASIKSAVQHVSLKRIGAMVTSQLKSLKITVSLGHLPKVLQSFTNVVQDFGQAAADLYHTAADATISGLSNAGDWIVDHKGEIIGGLAGAVVGIGCGVAIGVTGIGAVACAGAAGAVGSLVTDLVDGGKGWKEMAADALKGAAIGAVLGPLSEIGGSAITGAVRGAIDSGLKGAAQAGSSAFTSGLRSLGDRQIGGVVGKALANRSAGSASREAVETTGASARSSARGESCNSFAAGTAVLMANGKTKRIEDVRIGDKVVATDPTTGKTAVRAVTALITGVGVKNMVTLTVDVDGSKGSKTATIDATDGHPFWAADLHQWVNAADLKPGTLLQTGAGTYVQVTATKAWKAEHKEVHNLTVDGLHTYYVLAGTTPVLVHNCGTTEFHTVQSPEDAARLTTNGGKPFPTEPDRAHFGPGVYSWGSRAEAEAYAANKPGASILSFSVKNDDLAGLKQAHLGSMSDDEATAFMEQNSLLWDGDAGHGLDYISRPTARGTEHYFSSKVFHLLDFGG
ncbi:RHS repeat-associated core domain-containing protein [Actinoplanes sp. NPDC048988]|uniref:RHS repeat-associated core domain-containing protein n=1 Tax=Actinoplanes sp. NPDC048988 TaxID=3363901 RepID=UPI003710E6E1